MRIKDKEKGYIKIKIDIKDIQGYGYQGGYDRTPFIIIKCVEINITEKEMKKLLKVYHN